MKPEIVNGLFALGGAALGALLTGAFSWFQNKQTRSRSELSIFTSHAARLIEVDSSISEIVEIRVQGEIVPSVYTLDTRILNTGTEPLHDGDVYVSLVDDTTVLAVDITDFSDGALDALKVERDENKTGFHVYFDYINPDEEFLLRALLTSRPSKVVPTFRQPGVSTRVQTDDSVSPGVVRRAIFETIRRDLLLHSYLKLWFQPYRRYLEQLDRDKRST